MDDGVSLDRAKAVAGNQHAEIEHLIKLVQTARTRHESGTFSARVDVKGLNGHAAVLATEINRMLEIHCAQRNEMVACLQSLAQGSMDYPLPDFPGEGAATKRAIEELRNSIQGGFAALSTYARQLKSGDLQGKHSTHTLPERFQSGFQELDSAVASVSETLLEVREDAARIAASMTQIEGMAAQTSETSQHQSAAMAQIASTSEHLEAKARQNEEDSRLVIERSNETRQSAAQGKQTLIDLTKAMSEVQASSIEISKIIKTIDEIAFQTNLLALNASVEAARAGEHGRGFAVVAQEVRNLAGRSARAAKDTNAIIETAHDRVQTGVRLTEKTTSAFGLIESAVDVVVTNSTRVSQSSHEQLASAQQISAALNEMAKRNLQTAGSADELAKATAEISKMSKTIATVLGKYSLRMRPKNESDLNEDLEGLPEELKREIKRMMQSN